MDPTQSEYQELAHFRFLIRRFLHFSESAAASEGIEPRQHQALLAIKAVGGADLCTIRHVAEQLFLKHQSAVGLMDRMEERGLVVRSADAADHRRVIVRLTKQGEDILKRLSVVHRAELRERSPELARALQAIVRKTKS